MRFNETELRILEILGTSEKPVTLSELKNLTGINKMTIKESIRHLREEYPICSNVREPYGYYISENEEQLQETINRIESQMKTLYVTSRNLKNQLKEFGDNI